MLLYMLLPPDEGGMVRNSLIKQPSERHGKMHPAIATNTRPQMTSLHLPADEDYTMRSCIDEKQSTRHIRSLTGMALRYRCVDSTPRGKAQIAENQPLSCHFIRTQPSRNPLDASVARESGSLHQSLSHPQPQPSHLASDRCLHLP